MTEQEWLQATDRRPMLEYLRGKVSDRKLRLFSCACCGIVWHLIAAEQNRRAVEFAERLADGATEGRNLAAVRAATRDGTAWCTLLASAWDAACQAAGSGARDAARSAFWSKTWDGREARETAWSQARAAEKHAQAKVLRDIFGNPFRPVSFDPAWLTWHNSLLVSMARQMYESRNFTDMPVLADALEDSGCDNADILTHCRQSGEHVRGCWVVDLLLGKQ
jgi:hypothetical protein